MWWTERIETVTSGRDTRLRRAGVRAALAASVVALTVAACTSGLPPRATVTQAPPRPPAPTVGAGDVSPLGGTGSHRPNIVLVLTDDLSKALVPYMPHVLGLERSGMTFTNYTVADSLCCPSRSSIFTGRFPHNTGVFTNNPPDGGFAAFQKRQDALATFATSLHAAGYRTAMMGKYLNGYDPYTAYLPDGQPAPSPAPGEPAPNYVAPGWSTWAVAGNGYNENRYYLNENHTVQWYGSRPQAFGVYVLDRLGQQFIDESSSAHQPFLLEVATFAPHHPYVAAPADRRSFPGLRAPRGPAFNRLPRHAPAWMAKRKPMGKADIALTDQVFRKQVQAVQSVDRMIGHLQDRLRRDGQLANTVFIFSSDNGLHLGQYTFTPGKLLAFDTDVCVPLVIAGPGIVPGSVSRALVQNIDLAPTFEDIAGVRVDPLADGHSIVPLLLQRPNGPPVSWRSAGLIEHHGLDFYGHQDDPDYQDPFQGDPPSYQALRTASFTYVRYYNGEREFYDRVHDPYELDNIAATLSRQRRAALDRELAALTACRGTAQCWAAAQPTLVR